MEGYSTIGECGCDGMKRLGPENLRDAELEHKPPVLARCPIRPVCCCQTEGDGEDGEAKGDMRCRRRQPPARHSRASRRRAASRAALQEEAMDCCMHGRRGQRSGGVTCRATGAQRTTAACMHLRDTQRPPRRHGSQQPEGPSEQSHALRPQGRFPQSPEWCAPG